MYLCLPDREQKNRLILSSPTSYAALRVVLNNALDTHSTFHFPAYDIDNEASNVVIIRNLPSSFRLQSQEGFELATLIHSICPAAVSIEQAEAYYSFFRVVRVTMMSSFAASWLADRIASFRVLFHERYLNVSVGRGGGRM